MACGEINVLARLLESFNCKTVTTVRTSHGISIHGLEGERSFRMPPQFAELTPSRFWSLSMWRAFFYSIGLGMFMLGMQSLVVDHVMINKNNPFRRALTRLKSGGNRANGNFNNFNGNFNGNFNNLNGNQAGQRNSFPPAQGQAFPNFAGQSNSQSRFGPSRFSGPAYGDYGGPRVNNGFGGARGQNASIGGFRSGNGLNNNAQLASFGTNRTGGGAAAKVLERLNITEWMPWSLLGIGASIFMFTHLNRGRSFE